MREIHYPSQDGTVYVRKVQTGPPSMGYTKVLAALPPEHLEMMRMRNDQAGGYLPVNEQIRQAVRMYLLGGLIIEPIYTGSHTRSYAET